MQGKLQAKKKEGINGDSLPFLNVGVCVVCFFLFSRTFGREGSSELRVDEALLCLVVGSLLCEKERVRGWGGTLCMCVCIGK